MSFQERNMAIKGNTINAVGYGLTNALQSLAPQPILANRAPNVSDSKPIGSLWCWPATQEVWVNDGIVAGNSQWILISQGGAGVFSSLTVNPGPTVLDGAVTITAGANPVHISTTDNVASAISLTTDGGTTETIVITNTLGTGAGAITLNAEAGAVLIESGVNSAGSITLDATAGGIILESALASATAINIEATNAAGGIALTSGTGGIALSSGTGTRGLISVAPAIPTAASPTATVTANTRVIHATFTGFTTADAGAAQAYTIASSEILTTSAVQVTVTNLNASGNGAFLTITGIIQAAGSIIVNTANNGAGALGAGDNVLISVWVLN